MKIRKTEQQAKADYKKAEKRLKEALLSCQKAKSPDAQKIAGDRYWKALQERDAAMKAYSTSKPRRRADSAEIADMIEAQAKSAT